MTDEWLIAEAARVGPVLRARPGALDRHAGWLLKEMAARLEARAEAQE